MDGQFPVEWEAGIETRGQVMAVEGEKLLDVFRRNQVYLESACNANGTCGKCRVQVVQGMGAASAWEQRFFTEEELAKGYRLACLVKAEPGLKVRLLNSQTSGQDEAGGLGIQGNEAGCMNVQKGQEGCMDTQDGMNIAVDLGTTTLAAVLLDAGGNILAQETAINSQRAYGADVISRIQVANQGYGECLQACICKDLEHLFQALCTRVQQQVMQLQITRIVIAGNTAMLHLLRGYSCQSLGNAPFEPASLKMECFPYGELFSEVPECKGGLIYLLPGLSAFVGADITAGLYSSGFYDTPDTEVACFVDLGTNGEMAVGNNAGFVTASAPAGPAFEGGNLSCGMPGIPGAISNVSFLFHRVRIQTVGQKKPCGICGTGALEAVAALRKEGLLDANGLLVPKLFETGLELAKREDGSKICLTQADIREIQMAKAAIRAGLETLFEHFCKGRISEGMGFGQISHVYLAGGFGYYLSADTAMEIGLFPAKWKGKIVVCGNTSLKGAAEFVSHFADPIHLDKMNGICKKNKGIQLAEDERFQSLFVERMQF